MRAVNLLPRDTGQNNINLPSAPVVAGVCAGLVVAAVLGADFMMQSGNVTKEQRKLDGLQARVAKLPAAPPGPTSSSRNLASEHNARVVTLSAAMSSRVAWDRVLREFSLILPNDVWLTSLAAASPASASGTTAVTPPTGTATAPTATPGSTSGPTQFVIDGHTYSQDSVARLLSRLQTIPDLKDVTLVSSKVVSLDSQIVVEFTIAANIRTATGASQ